MALQKAFNVLAHFKFEVGAAQVGMTKMETGLEKISKQAKEVNSQFKVLFAQSALSFTGGQAGIIGTIQKMASASEEYYNFQRKMATLITGNTKGTKDFNTAMRTSADILKDIAKDASLAQSKKWPQLQRSITIFSVKWLLL